MANLTYKELKERVTIIEVARHLGYELDISKGTKSPSYVLEGSEGSHDRIYIKNPNIPGMQGYWRRGTMEKGDVIDFVRENLDKFSVVSAYNDTDKLNKVLHGFANHFFSSPTEDKAYKELFTPKKFEESRWIIDDNSYHRDRLLEGRGIDRYSSSIFANHIRLIRDANAKNKYVNLGFPYRVPGKDKLVGYEIRGISGFKSKAAGTDSTNGMWIADFTRSPLEVRNLYVAESAFDALSYYQLNRNHIDLYSSVFVSFGGSFSDNQFNTLIEYYDMAKANLLFDNDLYGNLYDIRAYALTAGKQLSLSLDNESNRVNIILDGKSVSLEATETTLNALLERSGNKINPDRLSIIKPQSNVKDWNDILQQESQTESKSAIRR